MVLQATHCHGASAPGTTAPVCHIKDIDIHLLITPSIQNHIELQNPTSNIY